MKGIEYSIVSTILNEEESIASILSSMANQTWPPSELIVVDGGSTDDGLRIMENLKPTLPFRLSVISAPGLNVAQGRNLAIKNATCDIICSIDFGCTYTTQWAESLLQHFSVNSVDVVAGNYSVDFASLSSPIAHAEFVLQNGYTFPLDNTFTGTSRSIAYKKEVWQKIGGYPEWLTLASDDSTFWKQIKAAGFVYRIEPYTGVFWQRHKTMVGFLKEAYRYGLGDGESHTNLKNTFSHVIELGCRYFLLFTLLLSFIHFEWWVLIAWGVCSFGLRSYVRTLRNFLRLQRLGYFLNIKTLGLALLLLEKLRWSYLKGYFYGYFFETGKKEHAHKLKKKLGKYAG